MKTAIVTDTNSGIFPEEGKELGVFVLPMPVIVEQNTYYEGVDLSSHDLYGYLSMGRKVSTSQPVLGELMSVWENVLEAYDELVYIPMSSGLSSSFQVAQGMAKEYGGRVKVVDNHRVSVTLKSSVLDAKQMADKGCTAKEIKETLEGTAFDSLIYVGVDTLEYLKKSGRVTAAGAALGIILNLKPLLKIEGGKLDAFAKVRGTENLKKRITSEMQKCADDFLSRGWQINIGVADSCPDKKTSREWQKMAALCGYSTHYSPLTCSIASHTGPNAFGVGISRKLV